MNKDKIILGAILIGLLVLTTGCSSYNPRSDNVANFYVDMPESTQTMTKTERIDFCDNMCNNWGFRHTVNRGISEVRYDDDNDIFYCYCD